MFSRSDLIPLIIAWQDSSDGNDNGIVVIIAIAFFGGFRDGSCSDVAPLAAGAALAALAMLIQWHDWCII